MMRFGQELSLSELFGVSNPSTRHLHHWSSGVGCLRFAGSQIRRPPLDRNRPCAPRVRERQSMTDRTLSISAALREAQLQRLEASLASKAVAKPQVTKTDAIKGNESKIRD